MTRMDKIYIRDEFIKLGQAMKLAGMVYNGAEAKEVIQGGDVQVNGQAELRRGRKLVPGDVFTFGQASAEVARRQDS